MAFGGFTGQFYKTSVSFIEQVHCTQTVCVDLPNNLMSKNWIPIANDFSSEATDLKRDGKIN